MKTLQMPSACLVTSVLLTTFTSAAAFEIPDIIIEPPVERPPDTAPPELRAPERAIAFPERFVRGDADSSGKVDLSDGLATLASLFLGDRHLDCLDAADANGDGAIAISDAIHTFGFLFLGGVALAAPYPSCGVNPIAGGLGCEESPPCEPFRRTSLFQITSADGGYLIDLPGEMVEVLPDGVGVGVDSTAPRPVSTSGVIRKVSPMTILLETSSDTLGRAAGMRLGLRVDGQIAFPELGYTCSSFACVCSGDTHCSAMFEPGLCGVEAVGVEDASGDVWAICKRE
jgi:hypothetical protein